LTNQSINQAILQIQQATTPYGIVASTNITDNYNRIWSRDSVIAGLAGLWSNDATITEGLLRSLLILQKAQAETGQLPSNVTSPCPSEGGGTAAINSLSGIPLASPPRQGAASYGGLTGRVDATTWWIIGVCEYLKATKQPLHHQFRESVNKAFLVLKAWEMNTRGLLYSPLGGNWADEYVTQGYTLYDNCLYLWALESAAVAFENTDFKTKAAGLRQMIAQNFYLKQKNNDTKDYHPTARQNATENPPYWVAALAPNGYDTRFDMAGNALAEFLGIGQAEISTKNLNNWLNKRATVQKNWLLPVFYPIIHENDVDWRLLHNNFAYNFKNNPHHFHNGGCWFVWLGFLAMALRKNGCTATADHIATQIHTSLSTENPPYTFHEYWNTQNFAPDGTKNLCFSAAGTVFSNL
jgi:Alkaline and neutral invertase